LSKLSKRGKLDLLNKESPELLELIDDFKCKTNFCIQFLIFQIFLSCHFCYITTVQMKELKDNLQPILNLITDGSLPPSPGVDYIKARYNIIMKYNLFVFNPIYHVI
jgi:U3 small nucleolar RNA-associated protein 3